MSRLTRSEIAVLDALADELDAIVPDMPGQIAEALAGKRRNTGAGFFTEIIVDRHRPLPADGPTGALGSVHGDIPGVSDPVAFQAVFARGRLVGLQATTYDESTAGLDLESTRITDLFRIDEHGYSVAWDATEVPPSSVLVKLQEQLKERYPEPRPEPRLVNVGPVQRVQETGPASAALDVVFGKKEVDAPDGPVDVDLSDDDLLTTRIGLVVLYFAVASLAVIVFRTSLFLVIFAGVAGVNLLKNRRALTVAKRLFDKFLAGTTSEMRRSRDR